MKNVYINEIPVDLFLKYFDENTVDKTNMTPVYEDLKSKVFTVHLENLTDSSKSGKLMIPSGELDINEICKSTGFSAYTESIPLESDGTKTKSIFVGKGVTAEIKYTVNIISDSSTKTVKISNLYVNDTLIDFELNTNKREAVFLVGSNKIVTASATIANLENPISVGFVSLIGSDEITLTIDSSENNVIYSICNNEPYIITKNETQFGSFEARTVYAAPASSGVIPTMYEYTLEIVDSKQKFYKYSGMDFVAIVGGIATPYSAINDSACALCGFIEDSQTLPASLANDKYNDEFTYYTCNKELTTVDGAAYYIKNIVKNIPIKVQKMSPDGKYIYQDKFGYTVYEDSKVTNLSRQRNALRSTFYDISSMAKPLTIKVKEGELAYIQKGNDIQLVNYLKYCTQDAYTRISTGISYDKTGAISKSVSDYFDSQGVSTTLFVSKDFSTKINTLIDSSDIPTIKGYTTSFINENTNKSILKFDEGLKIIENTPYFITPYIRRYTLFPGFMKGTLALTNRIAKFNIEVGMQDTNILSSSDYTEDICKDIIENPGTSVSAKEMLGKYIFSYDNSVATITVGSGDRSSIEIKSMQMYNTESENAYFLFPIYIKNSIKRKSTAGNGNTILTVSFKDNNSSNNTSISYKVLVSGQRFFLTDMNEKESRYYLYTISEAASILGIDVKQLTTLDALATENIYICKVYVNKMTEELACSENLLGTLKREISKKLVTSRSGVTIEDYITSNYVLNPINLSGEMPSVSEDSSIVEYFSDIKIKHFSASSSTNTLSSYLTNIGLLSKANYAKLDKYLAVTFDNDPNTYYITKEVIRNIYDLNSCYIHFSIYSCKTDRMYDYSNEIKTLELSEIIKNIPGVFDNYYIGRNSAVNDNVYFNKKKAAISEILKGIIDDPYNESTSVINNISGYTKNGDGNIDKVAAVNSWIYNNKTGINNALETATLNGLSISSQMSGMNIYDKERVYSGGLYYFSSHDGALNTVKNISIRNLSSLDNYYPVLKMTEYKSTIDVKLAKSLPGLTEEDLNKLQNMSAFKHLLKYKEYPVLNDYYKELESHSKVSKDISATQNTTMINNDNTPTKISSTGEVSYSKIRKYGGTENLKSDLLPASVAVLMAYGSKDYIGNLSESDFNDTFTGIDTKISEAKASDLDKSKNDGLYKKMSFSYDQINELIKTVLDVKDNDIQWEVL